MRGLVMILVATTAMTAVLGQYQQPSSPNYVPDEYADYEQRPRPAHPTPRSYATGSPGSERQQSSSAAAAAPKPTPVAILKQINRHNEDGSYTYGFEGGDGSFKIETKLANGEVKGKYGFVDDTGKVRVVEYGANQYGFQPAGEGITVAPPTLVDETTNKDGVQNQNYQDYDYQQPAKAAPQQPQRAVAQPVAPPPPQRQYQPQYEQPAPPPSSSSHTQAIYNPQQARARGPPPPKPAVFAPAQQPHQSQLLRTNYDEPAPASQAFNQGPVQFSPAPVQERAQPHARQPSQPSGGILDQLARDYALPQGGSAPLHDISFGYY